MSLPKIVQDQIFVQQRDKLGNIKSPAIKSVSFADTKTVLIDENKTIQWSKKFYILDRSNLDILSKETFNNTDEFIQTTSLPPSIDGSLKDANILVHSNVEYAIDVFSNTRKNYQFRLVVQFGSLCNIYRRDLINGEFVTSLISSLNGTTSVNFAFNSQSWSTIIVYFYNSVDNNSVNMFLGLSSAIDSWRFPDVEPPEPPIWYDPSVTTVTNSLTGVNSNVLQWVLPLASDWAGNNIYLYTEHALDFSVENQSYDVGFNAFFLNTANPRALNEFPAGSNIKPNS